jgi:hypothetical protein
MSRLVVMLLLMESSGREVSLGAVHLLGHYLPSSASVNTKVPVCPHP